MNFHSFNSSSNIQPVGQRGLGVWQSLVTRTSQFAREDPGRIAFIFLKDGETEERRITYGELNRRAERIAGAIQKRASPGSRVLLLFPQGADFIEAFFGVLYADSAAVPAPSPQGNRGTRARLQSIALDVSPDLVLTGDDLADQAAVALEGCDAPAPVTLGELEADGATAQADPGKGHVALIQYTSGSTGDPKGVVITHGNVMANMALIQKRFAHTPETVTVNWLPIFHDMGLIGGALHPIYLGSRSIMMPPVSFLQDPSRWLRAISTYGGNTSGAPNFAYEYCAQRIKTEKKVGINLSTWTCAFNGSEPVRASTIKSFSKAFADCGFRQEAFYPTYGMAEATLLITGGDPKAAPVFCDTDDGRRVSSGFTSLNHEVAIINPENRTHCPDGEIGEIWFRGPSVTPGYFNRPKENAETFNQTLAGQNTGSFMRTGDIGFQKDGHIFVTGRIKDVLIVRGRNHYPHDVEATAQASHPALRADTGVAFLAERDSGEALVIVNEVERSAIRNTPTKEIAAAIRSAVTEMHGLYVAAIVLLKTGGLPKTSSGKVRRRMTRDRYLEGALPMVGEDRHGAPFTQDTETEPDKAAE